MLPLITLDDVMNAHKFVIPDIHHNVSESTEKDDMLVSHALEKISKKTEVLPEGEYVEIYILGDWVELRGYYLNDPKETLLKIINSHPLFYNTIKKLIQTGSVKIFYIIGNHDRWMKFVEFQNAMLEIIPGIVFLDEKKIQHEGFNILLVHGHDCDPTETAGLGNAEETHAEIVDRNLVAPLTEVLPVREIEAKSSLEFIDVALTASFMQMKGFSWLRLAILFLLPLVKIARLLTMGRGKKLISNLQKRNPNGIVVSGHFHRHESDFRNGKANGVIILGGNGRVLKYNPEAKKLYWRLQGFILALQPGKSPQECVYNLM